MTNRCLLFLMRATRMATPITMTTSMIKTTTIMMTAITDVVVARSVRVEVDAVEVDAVEVDAVGVDAVEVDVVERKHTTWHGAKKKTQDRTQKYDSNISQSRIRYYQTNFSIPKVSPLDERRLDTRLVKHCFSPVN